MMVEWLPDKCFYEYAYHKFLDNPNAEWNIWQPWEQWYYPESDIRRFKSIVADQLDLIRDQKIVDVGCHLGYISLFCLHNGARSVTGADARGDKLAIAREICTLAGYHAHQFLEVNASDSERMLEIYQDKDTALLAGFFYHIDNHLQILSDLSRSPIRNIIIESTSIDEIESLHRPTVSWKFESTSDTCNAVQPGVDYVPVGIPNRQWFTAVLEHFGFSVCYNNQFMMEQGLKRFVISAQRG